MAPIPAQPPSLRRLEPGPVRKLANWQEIPAVPAGFRVLREGTVYSDTHEPWPAGGTRLYRDVLGKGRCRLWSEKTEKESKGTPDG